MKYKDCSRNPRVKVDKISYIKDNPTLVHLLNGDMAVQHPIIYSIMTPVIDAEKKTKWKRRKVKVSSNNILKS